jgi:hypothetical protein
MMITRRPPEIGRARKYKGSLFPEDRRPDLFGPVSNGLSEPHGALLERLSAIADIMDKHAQSPSMG